MKNLRKFLMNTVTDTQPAAASPGPSKEGALENFILAFNHYEAEADLFSRCRDAQGFLWWDVARYTVQFAIATEKDLLGSQKKKASPQLLRAFRFLQHLARAGRLTLQVAFLRNKEVDMLYVSTRHIEEASPLIAAGDRRVFYVNKTGKADAPHAALSKPAVDFLLRLLSPAFRVPPEVYREASEIAAELREMFDTKFDLQQLILSKYKHARAAFCFWDLVLSRLPALKRVIFVNDDLLRPLVALARERGLETIEVQHGYMGRSHFAYSYPELPFPLPTLPDKVAITRDTGDIVYPVPQIALDRRPLPVATGRRDIDVLIGSSPRRSREMHKIVQALAESGLNVAIKLHPVETVESSGLQRLLSSDAMQVYGGEEDFISLVSRSRVFIPINPTSTTVFEAVEVGTDLVIVHHDGEKITSMCDRIATAEVNSLEGLSDAVQSLLKGGEGEV